MKNPSHFLSKLRTRSLLTVPVAALLLTFQTFHGELLQAQQIANTDWSLTEIPAQLPPPEASLPAPDADEPLVVNYQSVNHSQVSLDRQAEVRSKAEKEQYHFHQPVESPNTYRASNPQLRLSFHHTRDGLTVSPRPGSPTLLDDSLVVPDWSVQLQTQTLHLDSETLPMSQYRPAPSSLENQSSSDLAPGVNEWFINKAQGLEHGYTIQDPDKTSPQNLDINIAATTQLTPTLSETEDAIEFRDQDDQIVLNYRELHVYDHSGRELASSLSLQTPATGPAVITLHTDVRDAIFPILVDPVVGRRADGQRRRSGRWLW